MILYSVLIFVTVTMRVLENKWESIPMSMALIIGWCNTIYFARGFKMLGQFSIMIQKIIFGDLLQWFCLLFISIIGFSTAFHIIFQTLDLNSYIYFQDYSMTLYTTVELLMGLIDLPVDPNKSTPVIVFIMYVLYMIFAYLLMLNLLIAMMDDTFWRIAQEREQLWKVQIAASILLLEQRLPKYFKFRSGLSGRSLGFDDDAWYLGIEELMNEKRRRKGPVNADVMLKANIGWEILRRNLTKIINMKEDEFTYF
ncbi:transient receptor potential cation channel subfamily V member 6-like [Protopterus annectens]|uniref:transient receptor potential cation channel subfamily V member 6-like n=1 Tax=Protopterus annectens TaxID=7888 RepID=UPI001CF96657|nr:transient receptor potential cation channel subfamily V member 6-like [Protopterus annectens]